ncbi:hypothetical protein GA0115252_11746 [Streptomyces sp. DfronAA-171]|nr:hypothetical protein GA0115252_11746 [Streptomyces sp. DfronAA-171]
MPHGRGPPRDRPGRRRRTAPDRSRDVPHRPARGSQAARARQAAARLLRRRRRRGEEDGPPDHGRLRCRGRPASQEVRQRLFGRPHPDRLRGRRELQQLGRLGRRPPVRRARQQGRGRGGPAHALRGPGRQGERGHHPRRGRRPRPGDPPPREGRPPAPRCPHPLRLRRAQRGRDSRARPRPHLHHRRHDAHDGTLLELPLPRRHGGLPLPRARPRLRRERRPGPRPRPARPEDRDRRKPVPVRVAPRPRPVRRRRRPRRGRARQGPRPAPGARQGHHGHVERRGHRLDPLLRRQPLRLRGGRHPRARRRGRGTGRQDRRHEQRSWRPRPEFARGDPVHPAPGRARPQGADGGAGRGLLRAPVHARQGGRLHVPPHRPRAGGHPTARLPPPPRHGER